MGYDWDKLTALNGGARILFTEPMLATRDEVWFYGAASDLRLHSRGQLVTQGKLPPAARKPVTARHTLYKLAGALVVDVEVRGDAAVLRRGVLNGRLVATMLPAGEVASTLTRYRALGFKDGTPYNPNPSKVTLREYRKGTTRWTVHVDGSSVYENWHEETKASTRAAAIATAERLVAERERRGFALHLIELTKGRYANPAPTAAKGAPVATPAATRPTVPAPKDAFAAVDAAVARLRDLHARLPQHHFVAELIAPTAKADRARVDALEGAFFRRMHKRRLGRWLTARPGRPRKGESSWAYFVRTYGSITWILSSEADDGLAMFYCGNVSGGGWSCLEVAPGLYDTGELADASGEPAVRALEVFHGGWHTDHAFAFDTRAASPGHDRPIVPFGEGDPRVPRKPGKPVAFGAWLFARVEKLTRVAERNLRELA